MSSIRQRKGHAKKKDQGNEVIHDENESLPESVSVVNLRNITGKVAVITIYRVTSYYISYRTGANCRDRAWVSKYSIRTVTRSTKQITSL